VYLPATISESERLRVAVGHSKADGLLRPTLLAAS
jgi:hypothetical protein